MELKRNNMTSEIWKDILDFVFENGDMRYEFYIDKLDSLYTVSKKVKKVELVLPFTSNEFISTWEILKNEPKWRKKSVKALQASLKFLSNHCHNEAIEIMESSIRNGYQGLFELKNSQKKESKVLNLLSVNEQVKAKFRNAG